MWVEDYCQPTDIFSMDPLWKALPNTGNVGINDIRYPQPSPQINSNHIQQQQISSFINGQDNLDWSGFDESSNDIERYSKKVFVGGLPPDIDEEEINNNFRCFGSLLVDWPHKAHTKSYFPPKGYAFLIFKLESSVKALIDACVKDQEKLYIYVSSPTVKDKLVQVRPWRLKDADFVLDSTTPVDPRKTVFIGGVPRPLKAVELASTMDQLYGNVCYAGIDTDPELKYPKGAGRVAFSNPRSYITAVTNRYVLLRCNETNKRAEVKPYVLDDQHCDECFGVRCGYKFAPFFCSAVTCLQYYCELCWTRIHSKPGWENHRPLVKEGSQAARAVAQGALNINNMLLATAAATPSSHHHPQQHHQNQPPQQQQILPTTSTPSGYGPATFHQQHHNSAIQHWM